METTMTQNLYLRQIGTMTQVSGDCSWQLI